MKFVTTPSGFRLLLIGITPDANIREWNSGALHYHCGIETLKYIVLNDGIIIGQIKNIKDEHYVKWLKPDKITELFSLYNTENINSSLQNQCVLPKESFLSFLTIKKIVHTPSTLIVEFNKE